MASTSIDPNGNVTIHVKGPDGKRRPIRPGKLTGRRLEAVKAHVAELEAASLHGMEPSMATRRWLDELPDPLRDKVAKVRLCTPREAATLGAFIDHWTASRSDAKGSTRLTYRRVRNHLVGYFGEARGLRDITPADAAAWAAWMVGERGLARNTARKSASVAKQLGRSALRGRLVEVNPFADMTGTVTGNPDRYAFIDRGTIARVLDACPDPQWRLLVALARFGGLRIPSEAFALKWGDIDWGGPDSPGRFTVHSSKTEHHEGKASRVVPIFPELLPHLEAAFDAAEPGTVHCITRYRDATQNLRTHLQRIIHKTGIDPWPKLWQNLRSTRETELADAYPIQVVTAWIGNSPQVAQRHYLQVTDEHFARAADPASVPAQVVRNPVRRGATRGDRADTTTPPSGTRGH